MTVKNRVAIVTGATGGLGRVVTHHLAERGARLALLGRTFHCTVARDQDGQLIVAEETNGSDGAEVITAESSGVFAPGLNSGKILDKITQL